MSLQLDLIKNIHNRIKNVSDTPSLDAQVLIAHVTESSRTKVLAHPELELTPDQRDKLESYVNRLENGEPLPYVLGQWEFFGLDFFITTDTLIPRPETELLVEHALDWINQRNDLILAVDVGAGSGCISVSIATRVSNIKFVAADISLPACRIAYKNTLHHNVSDKVYCLQSDLIPSLNRPCDLICANLPYIPQKILQTLQVKDFEPNLALDGGESGIELIKRLLHQSPFWLATDGLMLLEIEASQGNIVKSLATQSFPTANVKIAVDLAGNDRLAIIQNGNLYL